MYAESIPARTIKERDQEYLFFGGTGYLGIHANADFGALVSSGLQRYGTNYGASRLGVDIPVFKAVEEKLSSWIGAQSAVLVSSGTLAGRLILEVLGGDYIYHYASNAHVAIHPGYQRPQTNVFNCEIEDVLDGIHLADHDRHVITFNTIDALTAGRPALSWISRLPKDKDIVLVADDSHALGVLGQASAGLYSEIRALHAKTIMIASLGKAMGLPAGIIAGPVEYIADVFHHPLFGGGSPMIPAYAHAYLHADDVYTDARRRLDQNMQTFNSMTRDLGLFSYTPGMPIYCTDRHEIAQFLNFRKIKISHFAYPSPTDTVYTRIILSALHTTKDIEQLVGELRRY